MGVMRATVLQPLGAPMACGKMRPSRCRALGALGVAGSEGAHRPAPASAREAYCFFGDSFVRLFGLVRHPDVSVQAFKGATCRGLGKEGNENRVEITRRLAAKPETKVAIFTFGNVDVHFSYYYSLHGKAAPQRH